MIPKRKHGRLPKYDFESLKVNEFIETLPYSLNNAIKIGGAIYYFNSHNKPKKLVQRKINGVIRVYREV